MSTRELIINFPFFVCALAALLFVAPMKARIRTKAIWLMILLACSCRGAVYDRFGGGAQAPELPELLIWIWDWACAGLYVLLALSLFWWTRKGRTILLPALAWGIAAIGFWNGIKAPEVREVDLAYDDLPAELDGYRILQISDLHCSDSRRRWRTQEIVDLANRCQPDLICLTGDYVDGHVARLGPDLEPLALLKAKDGVWAIRGNHEYFIDYPKWRRWYAEHGIRFLANSCAFPRKTLALGGMNDLGAAPYGDVMPSLPKTFAAATNGEFRILMDHRPKHAQENCAHYGVRLMLSGHTHGGLMPGLDLIIRRYNDNFVRGLYTIDNSYLYVSSGCGIWGGFPLRFFNPAEITLFTLRRR